ncbi:MAG TPA: META domain-containing protein [Caulobacterales bacterium]|nr:META domain-containing protein [Caulobacterales bacterium]
MRAGVILCLALALTACASTALAAPRGDWRLTAIDGAPVAEGSQASLRLEEARASGSAGCNAFGADVAVVSDQLIFSHIISTMMACAGRDGADLMAQEHAYLGALQAPLKVSTPAPGVLVLSAADGRTLRFTRAAPAT